MAEVPNKPSGDFGETVVPEAPHVATPTLAEQVPGVETVPHPKNLAESGTRPESKSGEKKSATQLGDFKLMKKLGQGGMGEVYLANQVSLDRQVALKILSRDMAKKKGFVERFVREARAMARIDHPHAVKVYAADSDKGMHYVAIEFVDGQSMQKWMDQLQSLPVGDAVHVVLCCADALAHAHEMNLIHRDIKPDNILVTKKGVVKVADFGLAKALDDEEMSMTQSGTGLGTPLYMPPEQARDAKNVDHRTDIYALGVMFYYFLTGKLPFEGETIIKLIQAKEKGQYPAVRKLNPQVPEKLALIIDKMIQKEPQHRYGSCAEVIGDLERLEVESPSLSFIDGAGGAATKSARGRQRSGATSAAPPAAASMPQFRTSAEDATEAQKKSAAKDGTSWYVRFTSAKGETSVKEMTTRQVQQGILSEVLDVKAQAQKKDAPGGFLPLAAYSEFQDLMKKRMAKTQQEVRSDHMKDMYAKIDKEDRRRKRWRWLRGLTENVVGGFSLVIYLIVVAVALFGAYWLVKNMLYPWISSFLKT